MSHSLLEALAAATRAGRGAALATVLGGEGARAGGKLLVLEGGESLGTTGDPGRDRELADAARAALAGGASERRAIAGLDVFVHCFVPPPVLHVIGAVHPAPALARAAKLLGFRVVVCDPRSPFATAERLPEADEIVRVWPDEHLAAAAPGPRDAVCVLSHDLKFDVPAIRTALRSSAGYVGVMGSRWTHEKRRERLREEGVTEEELARVHAPIGLAIGARTPEEIAVSIVAEIVAVRNASRG